MLDAFNSLSADVQKQIIASVSSLCGVILGFMLSVIGRRLGQVRIRFHDWKLTFKKRSAHGDFIETHEPAEAKAIDFGFDLQVFNSKDMPTGTANPHVIFTEGKWLRKTVIRCDLQVSNSGHWKLCRNIDFPSRQFTNAKLHGQIDVTHLAALLKCAEVFFVSSPPNGRRSRRQRIAYLSFGKDENHE